jgi:adenine/guanine/hypoxanthine permease
VGVLMIQGITKIEWNDVTEAVPAFLTIVFMPFAYSIADGIAVGFISYAVIKLLTGKAASVHWMAWIIAGLWVLKFALFGG